MLESSEKSGIKRDVFILLFFFVITRLLLYILGIRFDITPLHWFYQFLDPQNLRSHLLQSLFYLHSQPPGFNLFVGLILKLANGYELIVFSTIYRLIGLTSILALYTLLRKLKVSSPLALLSVMFFAISPPVIFYENWLFYTYPVTCLILISSLFLYNHFENETWTSLFFFFLIIALIVITRSLFHPIWFILILIGLLVSEKHSIKKVLLCALLPFLIIASLYLKNYLLFDQIHATSWFGMNLTKMTFTIPFEKITPLINKGEISDIAVIKPFRNPEAYTKYANFDTLTGIPVLDKKYRSTGFTNFNHIGYISVSKQYYSIAQYLIKKYPNYYGLSVIKAFYTYLRPCSDKKITAGNNRLRINWWFDFYEKYLLGDVLNNAWQTYYTNRFGQKRKVRINFLYIFIPVLYVWGIVLTIKSKRIFEFSRTDIRMLKYFMFNIIYVTMIGNFIDASENMRFRFLIVPFTYILIALMLKYFFNKPRKT